MENLESKRLENKKARPYWKNPTIAGFFLLVGLLGTIRKLLESWLRRFISLFKEIIKEFQYEYG